jgi:hypothetical protein
MQGAVPRNACLGPYASGSTWLRCVRFELLRSARAGHGRETDHEIDRQSEHRNKIDGAVAPFPCEPAIVTAEGNDARYHQIESRSQHGQSLDPVPSPFNPAKKPKLCAYPRPWLAIKFRPFQLGWHRARVAPGGPGGRKKQKAKPVVTVSVQPCLPQPRASS